MKKKLNILVLCLNIAPLLYGLYSSPQWYDTLTNDSEGWGSLYFCCLEAPILAGFSLFLGVLPSCLLYRAEKRRLSRLNLQLSTLTLGAIIIAWISFEPLRRLIIFGLQ
jgi:ABC-type spermidine/putrescine transport system permease subunit II